MVKILDLRDRAAATVSEAEKKELESQSDELQERLAENLLVLARNEPLVSRDELAAPEGEAVGAERAEVERGGRVVDEVSDELASDAGERPAEVLVAKGEDDAADLVDDGERVRGGRPKPEPVVRRVASPRGEV
eukprot:CAMPEP_0197401136 /NCGR_PEP_ID=MMETSP1165-20131217/17989_1 /TAXON_ID=284809 /ORGANISM="Chrysocystis fragilis, Strain CCMP3189" /LENGTH=133 /DNA_ID=CAMNT_0042927235 /DNA_START=22 /DNA_END=420 /DNA_ORIENTATION=-